jgi:nicotinamidase-related amidase
METIPQNAVLLIIDVQKGFDDPVWGIRNNPKAEENIEKLLNGWRKSHRPVFHVQHLSIQPGSPLASGLPGCAIKEAVKPAEGEPVFQKHVNSAFIGTNLEEQLRERGFDNIVIVGLTTPHCVSTTTRMAGNLGFNTYVVSDATAAFDMIGPDGHRYPASQIHAVSLATLHGEFATVIETKDLLLVL